MRKPGNYIVLEEDKIVELICKTGLEREELEQLLEHADNTGSRVVFYRYFLKWYSIRVSDHVSIKEALDTIGLVTT